MPSAHGDKLLPSQRSALAAFKSCRNQLSARMAVQCENCLNIDYVPHSCGHRNCPHCQAHESQRWIERQLAKQLPCNYFMITFTLPEQWRPLAWQHQKTLYDLITQSAWETVNTFSQNDKALQGTAGAVTVLHTHTRRLDYHPHVHLVMPAGAIDRKQQLWRSKKGKYLFNHKALAKVFRAKMLEGRRHIAGRINLSHWRHDKLDRRLQASWLRTQSHCLSGTLFVSWCGAGKRHSVLYRQAGVLSLPQQQNDKIGNQNGQWR